MIPDIVIPEGKHTDMVIASLIRQEALLLTMSERLNAVQAAVEQRPLDSVQDDFDAEFVKKLKDLARKLNRLYADDDQ